MIDPEKYRDKGTLGHTAAMRKGWDVIVHEIKSEAIPDIPSRNLSCE